MIQPALPTGTSIQHVFHYKMDDAVFHLQKTKQSKTKQNTRASNGGSKFCGTQIYNFGGPLQGTEYQVVLIIYN